MFYLFPEQAVFQECLQAIQNRENIGYYVAEQVMFMGSWIRHSTQYPRYQLRLFRKDMAAPPA